MWEVRSGQQSSVTLIQNNKIRLNVFTIHRHKEKISNWKTDKEHIANNNILVIKVVSNDN